MPDVNHDVTFFSKLLQSVLPRPVKIVQASPVGGGDIHHSYKVTLEGGDCYFIKCNHRQYSDLLEQEHYALGALRQADAIRLPRVEGMGECEGFAYLVLEWLALEPTGDEAALGRQLAQLHEHHNGRYGWPHSNFIGYSVQHNRWHSRWADFWRENRLLPQLTMAQKQPAAARFTSLKTALIAASDELLKDHHPKPSLLHGDLWGGNKAYLASGAPVIYDPASYYGDPETDVAFTRFFGGFSNDFYTAYAKARGELAPGSQAQYARRQVLYNLYHQLNHFNLFGEGYLNGCLQAMRKVISNAAQ